MLLPHLSQQRYECFPSTANPVKIHGAFWFLTVLLFVQKREIYSSLVIIRMHVYEMESIKKIPHSQEIRILTDQSSNSSTNALIFVPKTPGALIFSISFWKVIATSTLHPSTTGSDLVLSLLLLQIRNRSFQLTTFFITSSLPSCFWTFNRW